ncbi:unnamed protein product [Paramecium pentaurelia]|uniref:Myosin motor domain-containing protein n=1 Tax=Paramecium pentaurelia TaxID=43138 RepID=A0A8S1S4X1_9CILI|nr:unnamed protein product [Paramecium pentaurelia]
MFSNKVWVLESDNFIKGIIADGNNYISEENGQKLNGQVWERCEDVQADMVNLAIINDPQLLYNLSERYKKDQIFTYVGPTLIVINPFKSLNANLQEYVEYIIRKRHNYKSIAPHTYAIAAYAFTKLTEKTQAIVISGESGAGKTENARYCLNLLTSVNSEETELSDKIMGCNPILEAFGNAKTIRNKNSSRFGKYTRLFVNQKQQIVGGDIVNYLLEKSRVVSHSKTDRNFHIFYLLFGNPKYQRQNFNYLGTDNYFSQKFYDELIQGFSTVNIDADAVFQVVYSVLLIGELQFDDTNYGNTNPCNVKNEDLLKQICQLLDYDYNDILKALTLKQAIYGKEKILSPIKLLDCLRIRDSWAKEIYERLFNWIIEKLNQTLITKQDKTTYIGLLDIYGFEVFDNFNGFEQMMINYSNERLHQLYIEYVFKEEKKIFVREGLEKFVDSIKFEDNTQLIDMFDKPPVCLFNLIDQACRLNQTDQQLLQSFRKELKFANSQKPTFTIKHTAKDVEYTCQDFVEKNQDEIPQLLLEAKCNSQMVQLQPKPKSIVVKIKNEMKSLMTELQSCGVHFIRCIKPNDELIPNKLDNKYAMKQIRYLGVLDSLKVRKESFPIRVDFWRFYLKYRFIQEGGFQDPLNKDYKALDQKMFQEQFSELSKDLYLFGNTQIFIQEAGMTQIDKIYTSLMKEKNEKARCIQAAFRRCQMRDKFKKFMRMIKRVAKKIKRKLRKIQFRKKMKAATLIQKFYFMYQIRKKQKLFRKQIDYLKYAILSKIQQKQFQKKVECIRKIQKNFRISRIQKRIMQYLDIRRVLNIIIDNSWEQIRIKAAITIQKYYRGYYTRKSHKKEVQQIKEVGRKIRMEKRIKTIQRWARGYIIRVRLSKMHEAAYLIQGYFRMKHLSCVFQRMRQAAVIIQRRFRMILPRRRELKQQYDQYISPLEQQLQQQKLQEETDLFGLKIGQKTDYDSALIQGMESLIQPKIYLFAFIIDLEIISDTSDSYNGTFASNYKDIFIQSFEKENPLQFIQVGENTTIGACCNKLYGWGLNDMSQLGFTQDGEKHYPTQLNFMGKMKNISMGQNHCLVQQNDNKLFIWGCLQHKYIQHPKLLHENAEFIKAYRNRILYISEGKVYDQLKCIQMNVKITSLSCGSSFTILLSENGGLYSYGQNEKGQLGLGDNKARDQVERLPFNEKIIQVECGYKHVIALSSLKKVFVWGCNEYGQLGTGDFENIKKPKQSQMYGDQVMAGMKCSCVLNKQLFWCGTNGTILMQCHFKPFIQKCNYLNRKEYQIVRVLSSYSNNISIIYCTYACLRGLFDNNLGKGFQVIKNLTNNWVQNGIWTIDPPYVESLSNYMCERHQMKNSKINSNGNQINNQKIMQKKQQLQQIQSLPYEKLCKIDLDLYF